MSPIEQLIQALADDSALFLDECGAPVRGEGWAWKYANVMVAFVNDPEALEEEFSLALYRRAGTPVVEGDLKDLGIIARKAGFRVFESDSCIEFREV